MVEKTTDVSPRSGDGGETLTPDDQINFSSKASQSPMLESRRSRSDRKLGRLNSCSTSVVDQSPQFQMKIAATSGYNSNLEQIEQTAVPPVVDSIEQLYGQISMFDLITEDARGESDSEGEDANLTKYRARMEVLNSDLHEIFDGEDGGEGEGEVESSNIITEPPKTGKIK